MWHGGGKYYLSTSTTALGTLLILSFTNLAERLKTMIVRTNKVIRWHRPLLPLQVELFALH